MQTHNLPKHVYNHFNNRVLRRLLQDGQGDRGEELTKEAQFSLSSKQLGISYSFTRMKWLVNKQGGLISNKERGSRSDQQPSSGRSYKHILVSLQWGRCLSFVGLNTVEPKWNIPLGQQTHQALMSEGTHKAAVCCPWGISGDQSER